MSVSHKFSMSITQLTFLLDKIHDLITIDDEILLKVDSKNLLLYVIVGEKMNVNAFKSFIFKTEEIFTFEEDLTNEMRFIITNGGKFESSLRNYIDFKEDLECEFFMSDDTYSDNLKLRNGKTPKDSKYNLSITGGHPLGLNTNIDVEKIKKTMNKDNIDFKFILDKNTYSKIKKSASIDNENDILTLNISDKSLSIGEGWWDTKVCDIEHEDLSITFPKKYFKSINFTENDINIYVFDTFLLVDNQNTNLLIALELTV
jgi:hypothetical protein